MSDLSTAEQRARAGLSPTGTHTVRRGPPKNADQVRVDGVLYETVGEEERMDLTPDELADRREAFDDAKRERHQSRKATRKRMPLWMRLEQVTNALGWLQAPRARAIVPAGQDDGRERPILPPGGSDSELAHLHPQEMERRIRDIEKAVERLEEMLDAHRGLAPARDFALMDSHEKNAIILKDFEGYRPEEVTAFEPALGRPRTIRWVREQAGRRGVCGHDPEKCDCPGVRKAPTRKAA